MTLIREITAPSRPAKGHISTRHPCFASLAPDAGTPGAAAPGGRIHLPVAPACNIACRFCERSIGHTKGAKREQRPGVADCVLTPEDAVEVVARSLELCPDLSVAGIAGPGDTLANPAALRTFRLVRERFPHLVRCLSTNGLLLAERIDDLIEAGVDTLTVTVNETDPARLALINDHVIYHGRRFTGEEAAHILIERQLAGIAAAAEYDLLIKVNTVLIPGINDDHIGAIAQRVAKAGASVFNIIPLIPNAKMAHLTAPTCAEIDRARAAAERFITVFRHCQHCRADAIGFVGGEDFSERVYHTRLPQANTFSHG
ncbi:MAG: radical SAM protein [Coriobacteriales bacterium]|jgi:nitrogen fixation protein NifB|nr:radical SAM protein [Coriobacteriales bacterium]